MGGCSAPNCSNSTSIGKQLFRFPKDPIRMRKWLLNCRRDFVPTPCSRLCQDHFEESQFEEIARSPTGGRKLKPNAVPTLFNVPNPPSPIAQHTHSTLPLKLDPAEKDLKVGDHGYARRQPRAELEEDELQRAEEDRPCSLCQHYKTQLEQQQQHTARLQREVEEMKKRLHRLSRMEKGLQMFLYEDQIRALTLTKRSRRAVWSHDTVLTARKIRCAVGVKGYEFLRELGYPLPSYRTLCNRLEPKMMMSASMQEDLAELGLGIITACESPDENGTSDEALIGIMT
ncbi:THAP domain-containing protein 1 isoform X1 [Silurus meridionalis]|uniref:THAP domain-containing protein 1 isoform X1 n=1 Tax=Silurus meridionalis TaxID=175797 RepID=UPI001EEB7C1E|nr:THAP domain-containing protein 1 isoform X1 [Silurus meridionalis]XP_046733135.1 THAP domain-containing protein 1 isoform X1 [Silurus meridionalis]